MAKKRFAKLRLYNIVTRYDDGAKGWAEYAPYDGIIVTCAVKEFPAELLKQLKEGGRLIIPMQLESSDQYSDAQHLQIITKTADGHTTTNLELVRFVPLVTGKE